MRHIISILVENEAGALSRIVGLFSARDFNIESLTVAPTEDRSLSRVTLMTIGSDKIVEQITKQLNKLVDVVKLSDLSESEHVERELMLIKLRAKGQERANILQIVDVFRCRVLDVSEQTITIEGTGTSKKLDALLNILKEEQVIEVARTGVCGLARGKSSLRI